jgi:hypothetical protein
MLTCEKQAVTVLPVFKTASIESCGSPGDRIRARSGGRRDCRQGQVGDGELAHPPLALIPLAAGMTSSLKRWSFELLDLPEAVEDEDHQ